MVQQRGFSPLTSRLSCVYAPDLRTPARVHPSTQVWHLAVGKTACLSALNGLRDLLFYFAPEERSIARAAGFIGADEAGSTVTTSGVQLSSTSVLAALLNTPNFEGETPLHKAAFLDKPECVEWLLQHVSSRVA